MSMTTNETIMCLLMDDNDKPHILVATERQQQ